MTMQTLLELGELGAVEVLLFENPVTPSPHHFRKDLRRHRGIIGERPG